MLFTVISPHRFHILLQILLQSFSFLQCWTSSLLHKEEKELWRVYSSGFDMRWGTWTLANQMRRGNKSEWERGSLYVCLFRTEYANKYSHSINTFHKQTESRKSYNTFLFLGSKRSYCRYKCPSLLCLLYFSTNHIKFSKNNRNNQLQSLSSH